MYFVLSKTPNNILPFQRKLGKLFLSLAYDNNFFGYQLGHHGGNFIKFHDNIINFSYHKDYKLYSNNDIILTNLEIDGVQLPNDIISLRTNNLKTERYEFTQFSELSYNVVVNRTYELLLENLKECQKLTNLKIVFTAGLDSSTLAFIAHAHKIDFTCLIDSRFKERFINLPFKHIQYVNFQASPDFDVSIGPKDNVREGFYQTENNMLVTGYFGDNCLLHNIDMFYQAKLLHKNPDSINLYDKKQPSNYEPYKTKDDLLNAITYINTQNYFRHWFDNFQILDPYRDPRLPHLISRLDIDNLIDQIGGGKIQRDIIKSIEPDWLHLTCDYKNDYTKF